MAGCAGCAVYEQRENHRAIPAGQLYGRLEIDITIDDSKAYTRPWTVRVNQRLIPGDQLIEFVCNENEPSSKHYDK